MRFKGTYTSVDRQTGLVVDRTVHMDKSGKERLQENPEVGKKMTVFVKAIIEKDKERLPKTT